MISPSRRALLKSIDGEKVLAAIRDAERRTSGEIKVSVSRYFWGNVRKVADRAFVRLGVSGTRDRNGILFFIVPSRRSFAVLGDEGIHARVGQEFWDSLAAILSEEFRKGAFTEGLVRAIRASGEKLAVHFPYDSEKDVNELPDDVDYCSR
ncbi:MAG: TPM domain-containing protein [Candidatus Aminicenantales bacterium]